MDDGTGLVRLSYSELTLLVQSNGLPEGYDDYKANAAVVDEFGLDESRTATSAGGQLFVAVRWGSDWPLLVVAQRYSPSGPGWDPAVALAPETLHLFIGAGTRLLAYNLASAAPRRVFEDTAGGGFLRWLVDGSVVTMAAESQLAAWDQSGRKLWSVPVQRPWDFSIEGGQVLLDAGGRTSSFSLAAGPTP